MENYDNVLKDRKKSLEFFKAEITACQKLVAMVTSKSINTNSDHIKLLPDKFLKKS